MTRPRQFTTTEHESVDTDEINSTIVWANPADGEQGIQDANDTLAAQGGGILALKPGTYTIDASNFTPSISSNVHVVGGGMEATTLRLADGVADSSTHVMQIVKGVTDASIRHLSIDGNYAGNGGSNGSPQGWDAFAHGISIGDQGTGDLPRNIVIDHVTIYDTIRSSITLGAEYSTVTNVWLSNSVKDHLLYVSTGSYNSVQSVNGSGFWVRDAISVGTDTGNAVGNVIMDVTIEGGDSTPSGEVADKTFFIRPSSEGTVIRNVFVRNVIPVSGLGCDIVGTDSTLDNYNYSGPGGQALIAVKEDASQVEVIDPKLDVTATDGTGSYGIQVRDASNVVIRGGYFHEVDNTGYHGFVFWSQDFAIENLRTENYRILQAGHSDYRFIGSVSVDKAEIVTVDGSAQINESGTSIYTLNGIGQEAAGAGNAPTAANWWAGVKVTNTDDGTVWLKNRSGTMDQIA